MELTAIVPIGNFKKDRENIEFLCRACSQLPIQLRLVLDSQTKEDHLELEEIASKIHSLNFQIFTTSEGNPGSARNVGLVGVDSPWVSFWDSDDVPDPKSVIEVINETSADYDLIVGSFSQKNEDGSITEHVFDSQLTKKEYDRIIAVNPGFWRVIYRREMLTGITFPRLSIGEDQVFLLQVLNLTPRISFTNKHFYTYNDFGGNRLTSNPRKFSQLVDILKQHTQNGMRFNSYLQKLLINRLFMSSIKRTSWRNKLKAVVEWLSFNRSRLRRFTSKELNVMLTGGLGNQLFQYSYALSKQSSGTKQVRLISNFAKPRLNKQGLPDILNFHLDEALLYDLNVLWIDKYLAKPLNVGLRFSLRKIPLLKISKVSEIFFSLLGILTFGTFPKLGYSNDLGYPDKKFGRFQNFHIGYFQTHKYALQPAVEQKLRELSVNSATLESLLALSKIEKPLVVHVRLTDYKLDTNFGVLGERYYQEAIAIQMDKFDYGSIWIFSDDIHGAQKIIPEVWGSTARWFSGIGDNPAHDLQAMRFGHGYVIGNSSFSWWAAFLSISSEPLVVAPKPWFQGMSEPSNLIPESWLRVSANFAKATQDLERG
jgi:glycosyltransferase involved in cell wall biosynthesis